MFVTRMHEDAVLPTKAYEGDAGYDLYAAENQYIRSGEVLLIGTGLIVAIPIGYAGLVLPRSGLATRNMITVANSPGLIDSGYRGELKVALINHGEDAFDVTKGMRIAQLLIVPYLVDKIKEVPLNKLPTSHDGRDAGGFGSSGK